MKKIYVLLVVGASFMMSACSDFLDREPLTTFTFAVLNITTKYKCIFEK